MGCLLLGTQTGGISPLFLPHSMIITPALRIVNVIGMSVLVSTGMLVIGNWRGARGRERVKLNRFSNAFCFAFAMALVRCAYAL